MNKRYFIVFLIILTVLTLFRLNYITSINLCFDEAYNWEWSQRLSTNYYSQPGMVAWWIRAFTAIGGDSQFFVRLPAVTATFISGILLYLLALSVSGSALIALLAGLTFQLIPVGTIGSILIMHDVVTMPFWLLALYFLWKRMSTENEKYWYGWALSFALAASGKISSLLMIICVLSLFVLSRRLTGANWLKSRHFYISLALFAAIFSHNIIWNLAHNFINYRHMFSHASNYVAKPLEGTVEFIGSQLLLVSPVIFGLVLISSAYFILCYFYEKQDKAVVFIVATSVIPLTLFLLQSLRGKVEGNWANIVYPSGFIGMYMYLARINWKKSTKTWVVMTGFALAVFISSMILYPQIIKGMRITFKPENDRFNEVVGWNVAGRETGRVLGGLKADTFIFGINYQTPAIIRYYTPGRMRTFCLPYKYRKGNQYDIWDNWEDLKGRDGLLVLFEPMNEDLKAALDKAFVSYSLHSSLPVYSKIYGATPIRTVNYYLCRKFKGLEFTDKPIWY